MTRVAAVITLSAGILVGCAAGPPSSPTLTVEQRSALETFELDAARDEAFRAAAGVMLDQGMLVSMSDFSAGLIAGGRWGYAAGVGYARVSITDGYLVWLRAAGESRTLIRIRRIPDGNPEDPRTRQFVDQVRERVLLAAAPPRGNP